MKFALLPSDIAIVGSRSFADRPKTEKKLRELVGIFVKKTDPVTRIVSGGARGIDSYAVDSAVTEGRRWKVHWPKEEFGSPMKYFIRNTAIVKDMKEHYGIVVAFIDVNDCDETNDTLDKAKAAGVKTIVFKFTTSPFVYLGKDDEVFDEYITRA